jgi:hypothetical protein
VSDRLSAALWVQRARRRRRPVDIRSGGQLMCVKLVWSAVATRATHRRIPWPHGVEPEGHREKAGVAGGAHVMCLRRTGENLVVLAASVGDALAWSRHSPGQELAARLSDSGTNAA